MGHTLAISIIVLLTFYCSILRLRNGRLSNGVKSLLYLCDEAGDFRNGNTHCGIDEGATLASRMVEDVKQSTGIHDYK